MAGTERDGTAAPRRLDVGAFRENVLAILREAQHGRSFLVTARDEVLAEIHPPARTAPPRRRPGALRGRIRMADDFDHLPPDVVAAMEGEGE